MTQDIKYGAWIPWDGETKRVPISLFDDSFVQVQRTHTTRAQAAEEKPTKATSCDWRGVIYYRTKLEPAVKVWCVECKIQNFNNGSNLMGVNKNIPSNIGRPVLIGLTETNGKRVWSIQEIE